jgi:hypothetical protein
LEHLGVCNCNDNAFLPKIAQTMGATYSQSQTYSGQGVSEKGREMPAEWTRSE